MADIGISSLKRHKLYSRSEWAAAVAPGAGGGKHMFDLLSEFRDLYEHRLKKLDEADNVGEDTTKVVKKCIDTTIDNNIVGNFENGFCSHC